MYPLIGGIVRRRRKQLGMTQEKLAGQVSMSRAALANIEIGRQNVLVHQLYSLAGALDLSPEDLLPQIANASAAADLDELPLPPGLKAHEKEQIARLLGDPQQNPQKGKGDDHGKQTKR